MLIPLSRIRFTFAIISTSLALAACDGAGPKDNCCTTQAAEMIDCDLNPTAPACQPSCEETDTCPTDGGTTGSGGSCTNCLVVGLEAVNKTDVPRTCRVGYQYPNSAAVEVGSAYLQPGQTAKWPGAITSPNSFQVTLYGGCDGAAPFNYTAHTISSTSTWTFWAYPTATLETGRNP